MTVETKVTFVARDGEKFSSKDACLKYESSLMPEHVKEINQLNFLTLTFDIKQQLFVFSPTLLKHFNELVDWASSKNWKVKYGDRFLTNDNITCILTARRKYVLMKSKEEDVLNVYTFNSVAYSVSYDFLSILFGEKEGILI